MITLAEQDGGPDVSETFSHSVLSLRKLLAGLSAEDYARTPEFALILRVNGRITNFGKEGVEKPILRKAYVQVDIVVPRVRWNVPEEAQRRYLVEVVREALMAVADALEKKTRLVSRERLISDFESISKAYLASCDSGL